MAPPSKETCSAALVSLPSVAEPEAGVRVTVVGEVLVWFSVTLKSRWAPSTTVGLETEATAGRSSSLPPEPVPSSAMAVETEAVPSVALVGADSETE